MDEKLGAVDEKKMRLHQWFKVILIAMENSNESERIEAIKRTYYAGCAAQSEADMKAAFDAFDTLVLSTHAVNKIAAAAIKEPK